MISYKLKIFCALHRPHGYWQIGYHLFVISLSFVVGFCLNVLNLEANAQTMTATKYIDCVLFVILTTETFVQLWCSSYKPYYQNGVLGKMLYLRDHWASKTIDTMGIATYLLYVVISSPASTNSGVFTPMMSFCHMVQILQLYRLTHRQVRLMMRTIYYQFGYLFSIILFTIAIFLILARCMFLLERQANPNINNIYDASWLVFVTIICIGFGDKVPVTIEGKLFMIFAAYYGIISFSILISLFGAQLAKEKEKPSVISLMPAACLIQNVWILHSMDTGHFWKNIRRPLRERDKQSIICLQKVRYLVSSRHFKLYQGDVTAFDENMLLYEHLLNRLDFIEKNIYHNSYTLNMLNEEMASIVRTLHRDVR